MTKDAKAAQKQRLAEALRANLRRRKTAQAAQPAPGTAAETKDGARDTRADSSD